MRVTAGMLLIGIGVALAGCGDAELAADDSLYLRTPRGIAVIQTGASQPRYERNGALPSGDWSTMVHTVRRGGMTSVIATDPDSGETLWRERVKGRFVANVVSHDGDLVALSPARERYYRYGRGHTTFLIVGRWSGKPRTITVAGNYEPEAFSVDGTSVFVVSYLPARSPKEYQVRRLDLGTGTVEGVFTPHDELQERMGGTARIQAASADGNRLYTLYTVKTDGTTQAFIHVLDLEGQWAHCIDLPEGFGESAESATALALSPEGDRFYAANVVAGKVAEIDTQTLDVGRVASFEFDPRGPAHAAVASDGSLYVTSGPWVMAIDTSDLTERKTWAMDDGISGVQAGADPTKLYLALGHKVGTLNVTTGTTKLVNPEGIGRIQQLGPAPEPVDEEPILDCAC